MPQLLQTLVLAGWQAWGAPSGPWWTAMRQRLQGATGDQDLDRDSESLGGRREGWGSRSWGRGCHRGRGTAT